ncbi:MAG: TlpA family protein disulfide reductase [Candidatus Rokubacteria bacterium]|nr:TlpA family protein disulfide reductase [Candidatus Rokubacteria bacterium]
MLPAYGAMVGRGLEVLLISFREPPDTVRRAVQERGYVAPVLLDQGGEVTAKGYGVWGPPTAYVVDRQGRLIARGVGAHDWSGPAARRLFEDLLESRR